MNPRSRLYCSLDLADRRCLQDGADETECERDAQIAQTCCHEKQDFPRSQDGPLESACRGGTKNRPGSRHERCSTAKTKADEGKDTNAGDRDP